MKAGNSKMLARIANREDPDLTASGIWVCTVKAFLAEFYNKCRRFSHILLMFI